MVRKMIVMVKRKQGLTPEEFRAGYEGSHSRIAVELFGHLWQSYKRHYLTAGYPFEPMNKVAGPDDVGFDAISEYVMKDDNGRAEMGRIAMLHLDRIKEDEARWFDQKVSYMMGCETIEEPGLAATEGDLD